MIVLVESSRDALVDTLMRPGEVVVVDELGDEAIQLLAAEDEHMVQALSLETADEPFAVSIGCWVSERCSQFPNTTAGCDGGERLSILAIPIANEVPGCFVPGCSLAQLLGRPTVGGRGGDGRVNYPARFQLHHDKDVQWTKEQITDDGEIAGPDVASVVPQEGGPGLARGLAQFGDILLNGAFADLDTQLEQFASNAFCAPGMVVLGHLFDETDDLLGQWWSARGLPGSSFAFPDSPEQVTMPAQDGVRLDDEQGLFPRAQPAGHQDEQRSVTLGQHWAFDLSLQNDELLAQEGILQHYLCLAA